MLDKLIELIVSAKAGAVSGVIILAGGAIVTATTGAGVTTVTIQHPTTTPIVEVVDMDPAPSEEPEDVDEDKPHGSPREGQKKTETRPVSDVDCNEESQARNEARQSVQSAFTKYHGLLVELKNGMGGRGTAKANDAIKQADALLKEIREKADDAIKSMGTCSTEVVDEDTDGEEADDEDEEADEDTDADDEDEESSDTAQAASVEVNSMLRGDAGTMVEVAERATVAMETVYNLAKSTVLAELESLRTPKPTVKPTAKATAKPKKPTCDDQVYAAKKRLQVAYDKFHGGNDKLIYDAKKWGDERTIQTLKAADSHIHQTYDKAREQILRAQCATGESSGMAIAERASAVLEQTFGGSRSVWEVASANKPAKELCTEQMYAAKAKLSQAFEQWHGLNDKLYYGMKSFASDGAIHAVKAADEVIHRTYDQTKQAIYSAPCSKTGSNAMELANAAAATLQSTHLAARQAVAAELASVATPTPTKKP